MHLASPFAARLFGSAFLAAASLVASPSLPAEILPPFRGPPAGPTAAPIWTGPYIGFGLGLRWMDRTWTTTCLQPSIANCVPPQASFPGRLNTDNPAPFDGRTVRISGHLGYNWQIGNWVTGLEGDFAWADSKGTRAGIPGTWRRNLGSGMDTATLSDSWDASLRGRIGMLVEPNTLVYATGGVTWLNTTASASCAPTYPAGWCIAPNARSVSRALTGWTVGGGVEWLIAPSVILRGEYRYSNYQTAEETFFRRVRVDAFRFEVGRDTHTAYVGISYLFGTGTN
jgi:outer membrane immunogenic protein